MKHMFPLLIVLAVLAAACNGEPTQNGDQVVQESPSKPAPQATTPVATGERDSWQRPDIIIETMSMAGDLRGKVIADLFADDGYFTMKFLEQGAKVIAILRDQGQADALRAKAEAAGHGADQLEVRVANAGEAGISMDEADLALLYGNFRNVTDKQRYFAQVRSGLKGLNQLWIIDWLPKESPVGPPMEMRITDAEVMDEMEQHGFTDIGSWSAKLPHHFLMFCMDFPEDPQGQPGMPLPDQQ